MFGIVCYRGGRPLTEDLFQRQPRLYWRRGQRSPLEFQDQRDLTKSPQLRGPFKSDPMLHLD